ncbi:hypothetical protein [Flavilitoribacter nigricans]|uniref:Uncharacterized protein n=1 Tax=Flavilitoribacter nigricans (strain ATCC 23147 / DSM 23189 / NBRC 102662 / NCIMB 1420 / SS-2) TaxID=1122177 RepID=A0A2D0MYS8_FLAN2|nr:hypothetical protein [Flavilitoribacter nigricans]PHN01431.1 hypothetical protein CRP01_37225 [Flavilitoribacter nigricans DSM 23189 = NBRC 102662]
MADWKKYSDSSEKPEYTPNSGDSGASKKLAWTFAGIMFVVAVLAIYFGVRSNKYQTLSSELSTELDQTKTQMQDELAVIQSAYDTQVVVNDDLTAEIETKVQEVEELQTRIKQARSQLASSKANTSEIKARLAQMEELKAALETDLLALQETNDSLTETNSTLTLALDESKMKVEQMSTEIASLNQQNEKLDRRLTLLAPAGFKADNFRIQVERRNDKLTSRARRADEIVVRFDLDNVPPEKQGARELYLTVTTLDGNPVKVLPVEQISVPAANEPLQISAADVEQIDLSSTQTVAMSFSPNKDLEAGEYNVFVYSDAGYLGATGFRLR